MMPDTHLQIPAMDLFGLLGAATPESRAVSVDTLPEPHRPLLDHDGGMTAALERHFGCPMMLEVLSSAETSTRLNRVILLRPGINEPPAELGCIAIRMDALPEHLHGAVRQGQAPFGRILAEAGIRFRSRPTTFLALPAEGAIAAALRVPARRLVYGRTTSLTDASGRVLADVLEILGAV